MDEDTKQAEEALARDEAEEIEECEECGEFMVDCNCCFDCGMPGDYCECEDEDDADEA